MEDFEIKEACDGIEASKIIKTRYSQTIIMALTTVIDPNMEKNMDSIGVVAYIRKSADKEFIHFKLQSIGTLLHSKEGGVLRALSKKSA